MKDIVITGAMASRPPMRMQPCASRKVSTVAARGSALLPLPFANTRSPGSTRSRAKACRMRGAPIMLPSAELRVAANTPAVMSTGTTATRAITRLSDFSTSRSRTAPSPKAITR